MALVTTHTRNVVYTHSFASPVGRLFAAVDRHGRVISLGFNPLQQLPTDAEIQENKYACGELEFQLEEYFAGERREFTLDVRTDGTSFQRAVWSRLGKIEYGTTVSYGEVARKIGRMEAARAVGNAVAVNPVAIIVPCHRVLPVGGGIGNYALRGIDAERGRLIKQALLELEGVGIEGTLAGATSSRTSA
jgi:methylated-DNA-[protein]-cysteine S-methyltransferase